MESPAELFDLPNEKLISEIRRKGRPMDFETKNARVACNVYHSNSWIIGKLSTTFLLSILFWRDFAGTCVPWNRRCCHSLS